MARALLSTLRYFNPRSPCGERPRSAMSNAVSTNFNPRSPCGERRASRLAPCAHTDFNPRSPCGERHARTWDNDLVSQFQPTLPVRGATAQNGIIKWEVKHISTHAPRAGSDPEHMQYLRREAYFNPRSPCGERLMSLPPFSTSVVFQPTLPVRGATQLHQWSVYVVEFQPTLPVRGATRIDRKRLRIFVFQPTLPVRGATTGGKTRGSYNKFQPTLPVRGATH